MTQSKPQVEGAVKVVMSLTHGDTITVYEKLSEQILPVGTSSTIQILRKNHKVLLMINGVETNDRISVNFTESKFCAIMISKLIVRSMIQLFY